MTPTTKPQFIQDDLWLDMPRREREYWAMRADGKSIDEISRALFSGYSRSWRYFFNHIVKNAKNL